MRGREPPPTLDELDHPPLWEAAKEDTGVQGYALDARRHQRWPCRLRARACRVEGVGLYSDRAEYVQGAVLSRSETGLLLEISVGFRKGTKLEVAYNASEEKKSYLGVVTVKWTRQMAGCFHVGVSIDHMQIV